MPVTLKSNDGKEFNLSDEACKLSNYLQEKTKGKKDFTLDNVNGETLKLVLDYLNHYSTNELSKLPAALLILIINLFLQSHMKIHFV